MLQSLNLDNATPTAKVRDRMDDASSSSDPAFSNMLALLAGTLQTVPLQAVMPTADAKSAGPTVQNKPPARTPTDPGTIAQAKAPEARIGPKRTEQAEKALERPAQPSQPNASDRPETTDAEEVRPKGSPQAASGKAQPQKAEGVQKTDISAQVLPSSGPSEIAMDSAKPASNQGSPQALNPSPGQTTAATDAPKIAPPAPESLTALDGKAPEAPNQARSPQVDTLPQASAAALSGEISKAMPESKVVDNDLRSLALQGSSPLEKAPEGPVVTAIAGTEAATAQPKFTFTAQVGSKDALGGLEAASSTKHALPTGGEAMAGQITQAKVQQAVAPSVSTIAKSVTAFSQVEGTIRWMVRNQEKSAELQLHPDKLGQVNISLRIEGQEVHARIWASEAATVPILQEHRSALEQSLREQGLNLGSFDLQSGNRGEDAQTGSQNRGFTPAESRAEALNSLQDVPTLASQILGNAHQIEVFA